MLINRTYKGKPLSCHWKLTKNKEANQGYLTEEKRESFSQLSCLPFHTHRQQIDEHIMLMTCQVSYVPTYQIEFASETVLKFWISVGFQKVNFKSQKEQAQVVLGASFLLSEIIIQAVLLYHLCNICWELRF